MKDAKGHGSNPRGDTAAHQAGINQVGRPVTWALPPEPGTAPIPPGTVRLFHQTTEANLGAIRHQGLDLSKARNVEGPKAIWADEKGFYGEPGKVPTVEFYVPKDRWSPPFVRADSELDRSKVAPENIVAVHHPWHAHARYAERNPDVIKNILAGEHDELLKSKEWGNAIRYIKHKYGGS